jgi:hypothetical protein
MLVQIRPVLPGGLHRIECLLTSSNIAPNYQWFLDTRSNVHLNEYTGIDQIRGGNGQRFKILHTDLTTLPAPHNNFQLLYVLHVSQI